MPASESKPRRSKTTNVFFRNRGLLLSFGLPLLCVLPIIVFYQVENWQGKHAWEDFKRESKAKGRDFDWSSYEPQKIPAEQNFFDAPDMQSWFVGRGLNPFSTRLGFDKFQTFLQSRTNFVLAEVTIVPPTANVDSNIAAIVLRYTYPHLSYSDAPEKPLKTTNSEQVIPLIVMDQVPLPFAVTNLTRQMGIDFTVDSRADLSLMTAPVSLRWENITARSTLSFVLSNYNLIIVPDGQSGSMRIFPADLKVIAPVPLRVALGQLLGDAFSAATNNMQARHLTAALGFEIADRPLAPVEPVNIVVRSDLPPSAREVKEFFPREVLSQSSSSRPLNGEIAVEADGPGKFRVGLDRPPTVTASDYLAWSDQFRPDFDKIHDALQRPYAVMGGDYDDPITIPVPNFVCVRVLSQTLAQRAQCYLLLNKPEDALREITLLHDLSRVLEARPNGKPMTLVAAMVNVAVTGLYVNAAADGMRLGVWREPQLAVLQKQFGEINLPPYVAEAFATEAASFGHLVDSKTAGQLDKLFDGSDDNVTPMEKAKNPTRWYIAFAPRGWLYNNVLFRARNYDKVLEGFDTSRQLFFPTKIRDSAREIQFQIDNGGPSTFLVRMFTPNYTRALQTTAREQTLVNEGFVVCALERYRLAHGAYPNTLAPLTPEFAEKLPTDLFGGESLKYHAADGVFTIYSIGWNERDDGGIPSFKSDLSGDLEQNDWAWPYSERP